MLRTIGTHLRNQWMGATALFLVLCGGTAWAVDGPLAGQNTVGSEDIINQEVKGADIKDGTVSFFDIGANQVQTQQVKDNILTGADIDESTLGQVPSAGSVANVTIVERVGNAVTFGDQNANNGAWVSGTSQAQCLPGETVIGGGGNWDNGQQAADEALAITENSLNGTTNVWHATAMSDADNDTFRAHVLCFQGG